MSGVWALLPVKGFGRGKSRLGEGLDDERRGALARWLFERVSRLLLDEPRLMGLIVITDDLEVRQSALSLGAGVLKDPEGVEGLGPVVDAGLAALLELGAIRALVCMSDLPRLEASEISAMLDALDDAEMVLAPDREDEGTNALGLRLPFERPTAFGNDDSAHRHRKIAEEADLRLKLVREPGLAWDLDGPDDLMELGDDWEGAQ